MVRAMTAVALAMALAACGQADYPGGSAAKDFAMAPAPQMYVESAPSDGEYQSFEEVAPEPGAGAGGAEPGTAPLMAYSYAWNFAVPTEGMQGLQAAHKTLCEAAGPSNCYVTNSYLNAIGQKEGANGSLSMRATEAWVRKFEAGVNDGLKPFAASVYSTSRGAEELTAQIVDHEARLKSMRAHRDALQKMLEDRPGKLSDLLEIQKALAEAQGNIDSRASVLAALQLRVAMSELTFTYQAQYAPAAQSIWRPVTDAFEDFVPAFAETIGGIIRFIAYILPLAVVGGLLVWLARVLLRRRGWTGLPRWRGPAGRTSAPEKATSDARGPAGP